MSSGKLALAKLPPIQGQIAEYSPGSSRQNEGFSGPTYTISGSNIKYNLPQPHALKPYVDTKAGELDTWPAHASGHSVSKTSIHLSRNKQLVVMNEEEMGKPQMIPKPRFLDQLESYLKKELRALGVTDVKPDELRLQAHREVFEYLVEDFKTYKPLLSAIKNEYEMMLAYQREQIRQLEPLKQMLVTVSEQCDQKIMQHREQEKQEIFDLKKENAGLYKKIDDMTNEQRTLQATVKKLMEELEGQEEMYRNEADSRKLLISEINDLKSQTQDLLMSTQVEVKIDKDDDPVMLKIALKKAREDERAAAKRLAIMEADYGEVVSRREFEQITAKLAELEEKHTTLQDDFDKLKEEYDTLLDINKQLEQQRNDFYQESVSLRECSTPRPDWSKVAEVLQGGAERWAELSEGKTSNELVEVLLTELGGKGEEEGAEYFEGQGTDESIPKYLRYEGQVRNRRLGKRDTAFLVKDIWREKAAHDAEKTDGTRTTLDDFLYLYLQRRFGVESMIVEWGYNLHDACQRFSQDITIGTFWSILTNEFDEDLFHTELQTIEKVQNTMTKIDMDKGNEGMVAKTDFKAGLKECFPDADDEGIDALMEAAVIELEAVESDTLEYKKLFMEDDEGNTGPFVPAIKNQLKKERQVYIDDIKAELTLEEGQTEVDVDALRMGITVADPEIDGPHMDKYLTWTYACTREALDIEPKPTITIDDMNARMLVGDLKRVGIKL